MRRTRCKLKECLFFIVLVLSIGVELRLSAGSGHCTGHRWQHLAESGQSPETTFLPELGSNKSNTSAIATLRLYSGSLKALLRLYSGSFKALLRLY